MLPADRCLSVDEAYFVRDGHKRVSIAKATVMAYIDANVQRLRTEYRVGPGLDRDALDLTAAEHRFRVQTGLAEAVPAVRFQRWQARDYGELAEAITTHAYEASHRLGRLLSTAESAVLWYEAVYLPTIEEARLVRARELIQGCSEAWVFL